jgi:hypothetical protein
MTSQNEEAEELMRKIEKEEEQLAYDDPDKKVYHLCIVNLVIGYEINALKNQTGELFMRAIVLQNSVLRQRQLRIWNFENYPQPGAVSQETGH